MKEINAEQIGKFACSLGAGRMRKEDNIDNTVGIVLDKKIASKVKIGDILATVYSNKEIEKTDKYDEILNIFKISNQEQEKPKTIIDIIK